ncbi:hypothetical protein P9112_009872 [Eukaryota sp. TZLM1-RC]
MSLTNLRILFIRHAECEANIQQHLIAGRQPESPLSELGKQQSILLGERLKHIINPLVYTSPLVRAKETARIALPNDVFSQATVVPELQEFTNGDWDGKSRHDVYTSEQLLKINTAGYLFKPPNGESQRMVQRRASNWLEDEILWNQVHHNEGDEPRYILIFSHAIVIKSLLHYILGFSDRFIYRFCLDNTGICEFKYNDDGWFPVTINDTSHLNK